MDDPNVLNVIIEINIQKIYGLEVLVVFFEKVTFSTDIALRNTWEIEIVPYTIKDITIKLIIEDMYLKSSGQ